MSEIQEMIIEQQNMVIAELRANIQQYERIEQGWREELTKVFPSLEVMSFYGAEPTARWIQAQLQAQAAALADMTQDRNEWHEMANKHLDTMVELQAELNGAQACVEEAHRTLSARVEEQAALKQQLADVTKERIRYELECKDLRRQLNNATEVLVENADLRQQLADVTKERDGLKAEIIADDNMIMTIEAENEALQQQLTTAQATIHRLEEEKAKWGMHVLVPNERHDQLLACEKALKELREFVGKGNMCLTPMNTRALDELAAIELMRLTSQADAALFHKQAIRERARRAGGL